MSNTDEKIVVGQIGAAHGVKGWVHVVSYTEPRSNLVNYNPWYLNDPAASEIHWRKAELLHAHTHKRGIRAQLDVAFDRNEAEQLWGHEVAIHRSSLPKLDPDEYYWEDLLGVEVLTTDGISLGELTRIIDTGGHSVMEVRGPEIDHLVPLIKPYLVAVTLGERVVVDWHVDWG